MVFNKAYDVKKHDLRKRRVSLKIHKQYSCKYVVLYCPVR